MGESSSALILEPQLTQDNFTMKIILFVVTLIGVAHCSPILENLPANADVSYEFDGNRLEGIKIDYNDDKVVYTAPAPAPAAPAVAVPAPAAPAPSAPAPVVTTYSKPAAPAPAAPAGIPTYYTVDDDGEIDDVATHVVYSAPAPVVYRLPVAPAPAPVVYRLPAAPAPAPVVYRAPTVYYSYDSDEDDN